MQVHVRLIATYIQHLPSGTVGNITTVDVPEGSTVEAVLSPFGIPLDDSSVIVLNGLTIALDTPVSDGDTISAFSAIAGG